ncbi:MAG: pseudouridine synthase [Gammaproteobacteria bacterium]
MQERIQKVLARAGLGSRRTLEQWIEAGRIQVNGKVAGLGDRVGPKDRLLVDGRPVTLDWRSTPDLQVIAYYKPDGEICSRRDPEGRKSVFKALPHLKQGRWVALGRLDINSSGLMIFTTDGELANKLLHPSAEIEREYAARVRGELTSEQHKQLLRGVQLDDGPARFKSIQDAGGQGSNHWYHVVISEGRQREVRRLFESQGLPIARLTRVRFGPINLPRQKRIGDVWSLSAAEIAALQAAVSPAAVAAPE